MIVREAGWAACCQGGGHVAACRSTIGPLAGASSNTRPLPTDVAAAAPTDEQRVAPLAHAARSAAACSGDPGWGLIHARPHTPRAHRPACGSRSEEQVEVNWPAGRSGAAARRVAVSRALAVHRSAQGHLTQGFCIARAAEPAGDPRPAIEGQLATDEHRKAQLLQRQLPVGTRRLSGRDIAPCPHFSSSASAASAEFSSCRQCQRECAYSSNTSAPQPVVVVSVHFRFRRHRCAGNSTAE